MTADLIAFLRARLDHAVAHAGQWHDLECEIHTHMDGGLLATLAAGRMLVEVPGAVCDCGGPARVLREVEGKRRIVDDVLPTIQADELRIAGEWGVGSDPVREASDDLLSLLALPYDDHPDYREEWRP